MLIWKHFPNIKVIEHRFLKPISPATAAGWKSPEMPAQDVALLLTDRHMPCCSMAEKVKHGLLVQLVVFVEVKGGNASVSWST